MSEPSGYEEVLRNLKPEELQLVARDLGTGNRVESIVGWVHDQYTPARELMVCESIKKLTGRVALTPAGVAEHYAKATASANATAAQAAIRSATAAELSAREAEKANATAENALRANESIKIWTMVTAIVAVLALITSIIAICK